MCGNKKEKDNIVPLVTPEELKLLKDFEAIILMPRINPIRTKLVPDYKTNWWYDTISVGDSYGK